MAFYWQAASLPKAGNTPEQNEDAYRVERLSTERSDDLLIALADGATEAVYSGAWARALVAAAQADWPALDEAGLGQQLEPTRRAFAPLAPEQEAPWYVRNKYQSQGSQATLLVATVSRAPEPETLIVRASSVGDCCLLLFQADGQVRSFPVQTSSDFGLNPALVRNRLQPALPLRRWEAQMRNGDFLLACSDALGKWALQCLETQHADFLYEVLLSLLTPATKPPPFLASEALPDQTDRPVTEPDSVDKAPSFLERVQDLVGIFRHAQPTPAPALEPTPSAQAEEASDRESRERPNFENLVEQYRAADGQPRLRDDDTTLVLCVALASADAKQVQQATETLQRHKTAAKAVPPVVLGSRP